MDSSFLSSPGPYSPAESDIWSETFPNDDTLSTTATSILSDPSSPSKPGPQQQPYLPLSPLSPLSQTSFPSTPTCSKCSSPVPSTSEALSCGHTTCPACIHASALDAIASAATGADFLPAVCCPSKAYPLATIGSALSLPEFIAYRERLAESKMPLEKRVYCADEECGMFIFAGKKRARTGSCPLCGLRTCLGCGRRGHMGACSSVRSGRVVKGRVKRSAKVSEWLRGVEGEGEACR
ncbi:hypothetical protein QBC34DRAFT_57198 [Podospora aff. communis PSN243]|uniref:IBR domain-containing protein n=1 Tax=Podospora aff. communis PSN243 TaxID=3040156 RepID=A0AAV9GTB4_9PEZI|nr:hypothetical protein QBC34DRAFT_57198 [Podospora aff. communis PSN243]